MSTHLAKSASMDIQNNPQAEQLRKIEEMKKQLLSKILTREAFERLARVRVVNPETASQSELYLLQIYQAGKLKGIVDDAQLKEVLRFLSTSTQKQTTIKRV